MEIAQKSNPPKIVDFFFFFWGGGIIKCYLSGLSLYINFFLSWEIGTFKTVGLEKDAVACAVSEGQLSDNQIIDVSLDNIIKIQYNNWRVMTRFQCSFSHGVFTPPP